MNIFLANLVRGYKLRLAQYLDVSPVTHSHWLSSNQNIRLANLSRLLAFLDLPPALDINQQIYTPAEFDQIKVLWHDLYRITEKP